MTQTQMVKLEALHNRATRYEVVIAKEDRSFLLGYTGRKSLSGLFEMMRAKGPAVLKLSELPDGDRWYAVRGSYLINGWTVKFTGRTQREAIIAGELEALR